MASRRQELSQRRKAVGFTQESLAEYLGVERSTVIRWEAGDSEPLPSIRPNLARGLQVSIDQLAELLTTSEIVAPTPTVSDTEIPIPAPLPEIQSPGRQDEPEFENLIHPQVAETIEALRQALRSAGVRAEDLAAMLLVGGSSRVPLIEPDKPARPETKSKKAKRLVVAGVLALALPVLWLSAPFVTSRGSVLPPAVAGSAGHAVPVTAIPAPSPGAGRDSNAGSADSAGAGFAVPPATPDASAEGPAQPPADRVPASHTTGTSERIRTANRSIPAAAETDSLPRTPAEMIATAGSGHRWNGFGQVERVDHLW